MSSGEGEGYKEVETPAFGIPGGPKPSFVWRGEFFRGRLDICLACGADRQYLFEYETNKKASHTAR